MLSDENFILPKGNFKVVKNLQYKLKLCGINSKSLHLYSWSKVLEYHRRTCLDKLEIFLKCI